ncbi:hypothetical protein T484DRAFT_1884649 [Baffinella frigidus]|nr:hypothetical protein T484DRAFT_1884649 [Cryptophyta sp. CCMP2293]
MTTTGRENATTPIPAEEQPEEPPPPPTQPNETIVVQNNIKIVNVTNTEVQFVQNLSSAGSGGLEEQLSSLFNAFQNVSTFLESSDLGTEVVSGLWITLGCFILYTIGLALDRSRYKLKYRQNHNLLILQALVSCFCFLSMANGHGRYYVQTITSVKPYNLVRVCVNQTINASNTTASEALLNESSVNIKDVNSTSNQDCRGTVLYKWQWARAKVEVLPLVPTFFYAKYVQWFISTNITLFLLCVPLAGAKIRATIFVLSANSMMIFSGFCAASMRTDNVDPSTKDRFITSRAVYWIFGVMFWILTLAHLNGSVRRASHATSAARHKAFGQLFHLVSIGWSIYPFAWVTTSDGFSLVSFRFEVYMMSGLDFINKFLFGVLFLLKFNKAKRLMKQGKLDKAVFNVRRAWAWITGGDPPDAKGVGNGSKGALGLSLRNTKEQ